MGNVRHHSGIKNTVVAGVCTNPGLTTNGNRYTFNLDVNGTDNPGMAQAWGNNQYTCSTSGTFEFHAAGYTTFTPSYGYVNLYKNGASLVDFHFNHNTYTFHEMWGFTTLVEANEGDVFDWRRGGGGSGTHSRFMMSIKMISGMEGPNIT